MKNKVIGVLLSIILIVVMGAIAFAGLMNHRNSESSVKLNYEEAYGISGNQYTVIFNNELKDYRALDINGQVYLSLEGVTSEINSRLYWDANENVLIYTKPSGSVKTWPDQTTYSDPDEGQKELGYVPLTSVDDEMYIAVEYVKLFTKCNIDAYTEPNRLVIRTNWDEAKMVDVKKETSIRYKGGVKAEVLRESQVGEKLYVLDDSYDDWTFVASSDGYIGWVADKYIGEAYTEAPAEPEFTGFEYTTVQRDHKIKMVWHQVMTEAANASFDTALANVTGMNVVSPTWFAFQDTNGNIRSIATADYVAKAHERGMEVWALFSNQFPDENGELKGFEGTGVPTDEVLSYTSKRENAVAQVISCCQQFGIDGINLDFENIMSPSDPYDESGKAAVNYIQFVRELSVACHKNNIIFIIDNYVPLYTQHYDRREQNVFADYLVIMGYDEHYAGGTEAGPVASIGFVEQGITDTLNTGVPASKVINGIPFYTRYWYTDSEGLKYGGEATMDEAAGYASSHNVTPQWLDDQGVNYVTYTGNDGNIYEMWLEDTQAVERKMQLITQYDLAGVSCWKLGQENSAVWSVISQYIP